MAMPNGFPNARRLKGGIPDDVEVTLVAEIVFRMPPAERVPHLHDMLFVRPHMAARVVMRLAVWHRQNLRVEQRNRANERSRVRTALRANRPVMIDAAGVLHVDPR